MAWKTVTDHEEIKDWAIKHRGRPEIIEAPNGNPDEAALRLDFPGEQDELLLAESVHHEGISWDEFFKKFEELELAFEYETDENDKHDPTLLYRFVKRNPPDPEDETFTV